MKFDIYTSRYIPDISTHTNRISALVNELLKKKFKIKIYTNTYSDKSHNKNLEINYYNCLSKKHTNYYFIKFIYEIFDIFPFIKNIFISKTNFSIIVIPNFSYIFLIPFLKLKKKIIIVDVMDLSWKYTNYLYPKFLSLLIEIISLKILKLANFIIVTNSYEYEYFNKNKFKNVHILSNGYPDLFKEIKKKLHSNLPSKNTITYLGNIGIAQNFDPLIFIAKNMKHININIYGDGSKKKTLKNLCSNISNINIFDSIKYNNLYKIYNNTEYLFLSLSNEFESAIPSKLYEYLASEKKILCYSKKTSAIYKKFNNLYKDQLLIFTDYEDVLNFFKNNSTKKFTYNYDNLSINYITSEFVIKFLKYIQK